MIPSQFSAVLFKAQLQLPGLTSGQGAVSYTVEKTLKLFDVLLRTKDLIFLTQLK